MLLLSYDFFLIFSFNLTSRNIKNAGRSRLFQQSGASSWRFIHFILMLLRSFQIVNRLLLEKDMVFVTMIDLSI